MNALGAVQSALVLGGGSEIAHATMRALVPSGCRTVVLAARRPDQLSAQVGELTQLGATTVHTHMIQDNDHTVVHRAQTRREATTNVLPNELPMLHAHRNGESQ